MKRYQALLLAVLFLAALGTRVSYQQNMKSIDPVRADAAKYAIIANNLLAKGLYSEKENAAKPSYSITPGYPFFLASIMTIVHDGDVAYRTILYTQAVIGAAVSVLTVLIAIHFLPFFLAYAAGILTALSPHLISIGALLLTETLFSFLLLLAFWLLLRGSKSATFYWMIPAGLLFGLAALVRPAIIAFPFFLFPLLALKLNWRLPTALILAAFLVFGSWVGWTKINAWRASPSASALSASLALGIYPDLIHKNPRLKGFPYWDNPESKHFPTGFSETIKTLRDRFQLEPARYANWYLFGKPAMFWSENIVAGEGGIYVYPVISTLYDVNMAAEITKEFMQATHPFVLFVVLLGAPSILYAARHKIISSEKSTGIASVYLLLLYVTLVHMALAPLPRYSIPFRPMLYIAFMTTLWLIPIIGKRIRIQLAAFSSA